MTNAWFTSQLEQLQRWTSEKTLQTTILKWLPTNFIQLGEIGIEPRVSLIFLLNSNLIPKWQTRNIFRLVLTLISDVWHVSHEIVTQWIVTQIYGVLEVYFSKRWTLIVSVLPDSFLVSQANCDWKMNCEYPGRFSVGEWHYDHRLTCTGTGTQSLTGIRTRHNWCHHWCHETYFD